MQSSLITEPITLSEVARATFAHFAYHGETTRRAISEAAEISLPTVTAAITELSALGLVAEMRRDQGPRGRSSLIYDIAPGAGWLLGVDLGLTQMTFLARRLDGKTFENFSHPHGSGTSVETAQLAGRSVRRLIEQYGPPRTAALALNQIVLRRLDQDVIGIPGLTTSLVPAFAQAAALNRRTPLLVENNVNCAAVAEQREGAMKGCQDAAYMQMGMGIGLGFFCDGNLIRGGWGASGELAQIPISWSSDIPTQGFAIEERYGAAGLVAAAAAVWSVGDPPRSSEQLFALASHGDKLAQAIVKDHAVALGRIAATAATILDPEILVLGGGLSVDVTFTTKVREEFHRLNARASTAVSCLGPSASVEGATILARDFALKMLLGDYHRPILPRPTLFHL